MAADSMVVVDGAEHDEVRKPADLDVDAPAQESTSCSMRPDDEEDEEEEEDEICEDELPADVQGDEVVAESRQEEEPPEEEGNEEEWQEEEEEEEEDDVEPADAEDPDAEEADAEEADAEENEDWDEADAEENEDPDAEEADAEEADAEENEDWDEADAEEAAQEEVGEGEADAQEEVEAEEEYDEEEEEEEEEWYEEDDVEPAAKAPEPVEPVPRGKQAKKAPAESFPPLQQEASSPARSWGRSRAEQSPPEPRGGKAHPAASSAAESPDSRRPASNAAGKSGEQRPAAHAAGQHGNVDMKSMKRLEEENRQLRLELGQATYKVQRLSKLREENSEAQRKELLARQNEARAVKELDLAKEYVGKRDSFARSEKAELLLQVKNLEETVANIDGRDMTLKEDLKEAMWYREQSSTEIAEAQKLTEKWRLEAIEQANKVKTLEQKLKQMEEKRSQDKDRLRELASIVRAQQNGVTQNSDAHPANDDRLAATTPEKVLQKAGSGKRANSRGPSANGKRKGAESTSDAGTPTFEDPIKPVKFSSAAVSSDDDLLVAPSRLSSLWLLLRGSGSLGLEGNTGAPGRGKGKRKARGGSAVALGDEQDEAGRRMVLGTLIVVIMGLAVAKLTLA